MDQFLLQEALKLNKKRKRRRRWQKVVSAMAATVVFCTTYALILPAITMEKTPGCGLQAHEHTSECYEMQEVSAICCGLEDHLHGEDCYLRVPACTLEEVPPHVHVEACYETGQELCCEEEAYEPHAHAEGCFEPELCLTCELDEEPPHTHTAECFEVGTELICERLEQEEYSHGEACYTDGELTCGQEETEGHAHTEDCYAETQELVCSLEETRGHNHGENCFTQEDSLTCTLREGEGHVHGESCYQDMEYLACGQEETPGHAHTEECLLEQEELTCTLPEQTGHIHAEDCYGVTEEEVLTCTVEVHIHEDACYVEEEEPGFLCGFSEHTHSELCEGESGMLDCSVPEHTHTADCGPGYIPEKEQEPKDPEEQEEETEPELICDIEAHIHGEECYDETDTLVCSLEEHTHTEQCEPQPPELSEELRWICGIEAHTHGEECYDETDTLICSLEEHSHATACEEQKQLTDEQLQLVEKVILAIEELPTWEEIETTIVSFEDAEDYEGEEAWLSGVYRQVALAYQEYEGLGEELQQYVTNRDALLELEFIWSAQILVETEIGQTTNYYAGMFNTAARYVIYTQKNGQYYAFDGYGNAVPIVIDGSGVITADVGSKESLLWAFTPVSGSYRIQNEATGWYMHAYNGGVVTSGNYTSSLSASGSGAKITGTNYYAALSGDNSKFTQVNNGNSAAEFQFGILYETTIWLDGTNGGLMALGGSPTTSYSVRQGGTFTLPVSWQSPTKYDYVLKGWYDVKNGVWYEPGDTVTVDGEMLFYADWVAESYDIGQDNSRVADTVSTSEFITTHMFDYNTLFNALSQNNDYDGGDTAAWTLVENGTVNGEETLNFIFVDYDGGGDISYPSGRNQANGTDYSIITYGLYDERLIDLLYNTQREIPGKHYIGTADHLFQYGSDPSDTEHYGYYYYDSRLNAASYNQSDGRFYVYDYLERTMDSAGSSEPRYADFLPLNSPYANTNGHTVNTYTYNGDHGEYGGVTHYTYDSKYNNGNNVPGNVITNYHFGMAMDLEFFLPAKPGTVDSEGHYANQSITGEDMVFEFSGDDDVWVLIDGELVLDIGGIHGVEDGYIDFSTGVVSSGEGDNRRTSTLNLEPGTHTLTMYYLERGSSLSNFKLRFNLSTRYSMTLSKEDTLTAHLLNGAKFAVYTDEACTQPAQLWSNKAAHDRGDAATHIFEIDDGEATMWGFAAGNTYYLVEIAGPPALNGLSADGIIRMRLNNEGRPDYEVLPNLDDKLTVGYTVHGFKVDEDTQEAFMVITNTDATESEPTAIYVEKVWSDGNANHSGESVTVYLMANGTTIQSAILNKDKGWKHTWVNLPKTDADGNPVTYTVREAMVPGYVGKVEVIEDPNSSSGGGSGSFDGVTQVNGFVNGGTYLIGTPYGYFATDNVGLRLFDSSATLKDSPAAQWTANVNSDGTVKLVNGAGMTLYYDNYALYASAKPSTYTGFTYTNGLLCCPVYFHNNGYPYTNYNYPADRSDAANNAVYNHCLYTTTDTNAAMDVTLYKLIESAPPPDESEEGDKFYRITNTPAGEHTVALTVKKVWNLGNLGQQSMYEDLTIEMNLLADGEAAGLVGKLNRRNGWSYTFANLPMYDSGGNEIEYTVEEENVPTGWKVTYGPVVENSHATLETTVTNTYIMTYMLPETGGIGTQWYTMLGTLIILGALGWYCGLWRKREGGET